MNRGLVLSNEGIVSVSHVEERVESKAKLSIYQSFYVSTFTCGHKVWLMTKRTRSQKQAGKMNFLHRVAKCTASMSFVICGGL